MVFKQWPFLHYDEANDVAYSHTCITGFNNLMVLHVHKERTDALKEVDIANELVGDSEHRLRMFGKFQYYNCISEQRIKFL